MASRPTIRQSTFRLKPKEAVATSFVLAENSRSVPTAMAGGCPKPSTSMGSSRIRRRRRLDLREHRQIEPHRHKGVEAHVGNRHLTASVPGRRGTVMMPIAHKQRPDGNQRCQIAPPTQALFRRSALPLVKKGGQRRRIEMAHVGKLLVLGLQHFPVAVQHRQGRHPLERVWLSASSAD